MKHKHPTVSRHHALWQYRQMLLEVVREGGPQVLAEIHLWQRVHLCGQAAACRVFLAVDVQFTATTDARRRTSM